jgi:DNA polymerase-3 subunit epsilon
MGLQDHPMLGIDLETTSLDRRESRIVSFAVIADGGPDVEKAVVTSVVNPGVPIPEEAAKVHGITDEIAAGGISPVHALEAIINAISVAMKDGMPLVLFNSPYDLTIIREEAFRHLGMPREQWDRVGPVYDVMVVDKQLEPYRKGRRTLEAQAEHYGVPMPEEDKHTAFGDAKATIGIARKQLATAPPHATWASLHADQQVWKASQAANFRQYLQSQGKPSEDVLPDWPIEKWKE